MKKVLLPISFMLCAHLGFAQLQAQMNTQGNLGLGTAPNSSDRLIIDGGALRIGKGITPTDRALNMIRIGDLDYIQIGEWEADDRLSFKANSYNFTKGNLGLGLASNVTPSQKLHVEGNSYFNGNIGVGGQPNSQVKLLLDNSATNSSYGLHSTNTTSGAYITTCNAFLSNLQTSGSGDMYNIKASNTSNGSGAPYMYGISLSNTRTAGSGSIYGIDLTNTNMINSPSGYTIGISLTNNGSTVKTCGIDLTNSSSSGYTYGIKLKNSSSSETAYTTYGMYLDNSATNAAYGISLANTSSISSAWGIYLTNTSLSGSAYGINLTSNASESAHGARITSTSSSTTHSVYGLYSSVSGGDPNWRYSGYFTGGKIFVNDDIYATLDVYARYVKLTSDERLKSDIKPLDKEMDKLYQLQGKSYKKAAVVVELQDSLSIALRAENKREPIEDIAEFGYLAQELKEVFPELVSMDSTTGYYAVNYIGLIPVIIEALKDQRKTIETLQTEVKPKEEQKQYEKQYDIENLLQRIEVLENTITNCCANNSLKSMNVGDASVGSTGSVTTGTATQEMCLSDAANAETMKLYQNTPNPFNERTTIQCYVPQSIQKAQLCVYTMQGVQVQCITITERGTIDMYIEAGQLSAGIYTYLLIGDGKATDAKHMILTK